MPKDPQQDQPANISGDEAWGRTIELAEILENITLPFVRTAPGVDVPGGNYLWTLLGIPMWGVMIGSRLVIQYWFAWLAASVFFRLSARRGQDSRSPGRPFLAQLFVEDFNTASLVEAVAIVAFGYSLPDRGLRWLLVASGLAALANEFVARYTLDRRRIEIENARHAMKRHQDLFK